MANIQHQITRQYKNQAPGAVALIENPTGNAEINLQDDALPVAANHQYHLAFTRANLQSLCISVGTFASGAVTVYTNNPSGSSPQDTIALSSGQTLIWTLAADGLSKCPFSADVTTIYVTSTAPSTISFKVLALLNQ